MTECEDDRRSVDPKVMRLAHAMAQDTKEQGAKAVLLMGSQVRGDSYAESDVDLTFIGKDRECQVQRRGEFLVSMSWRSLETMRKLLKEPSEVGGLVPALRNAFIVWDPDGLASQLKEEARSWKWESISEQCDSWVAEQMAGYTEDVQRLLGHLRLGRLWVAAVLRNVISVRMGMVLAVHLRILYETENRLWDMVSTEMGAHWTKVQGVSLGVGNESFEETCKATFELYSLAATKVSHLMNKRQREAVAHTCELIGYPLQ
jgi:hypothetical protein